jgi:predicted PurR-regulated permease PerM
LAGWFAALTEPWLERLRFLGGKRRAAAALLVAFFLLLLVPLALLVVALIGSAADLVRVLQTSEGARSALQSLVSGNGEGASLADVSASGVADMVRTQGERAWKLASAVAGAATRATIGLLIFVIGAYVMLAYARETRDWLYDHSPLVPKHSRRIGAAFVETGRGLVVGVGLTALVQGVLSTGVYLVLGIPRALLLGLLTTVAALIPTIGTALVWIPVAAGLAIAGRTTEAIILAAIGVGVISTVDNFLRPALSRWGKLEMPMFVVMVAMFGGLAVVGAWGLALGPLAVRLALEGLKILREDGVLRTSARDVP